MGSTKARLKIGMLIIGLLFFGWALVLLFGYAIFLGVVASMTSQDNNQT